MWALPKHYAPIRYHLILDICICGNQDIIPDYTPANNRGIRIHNNIIAYGGIFRKPSKSLTTVSADSTPLIKEEVIAILGSSHYRTKRMFT